jgi:hypothetical protein
MDEIGLSLIGETPQEMLRPRVPDEPDVASTPSV